MTKPANHSLLAAIAGLLNAWRFVDEIHEAAHLEAQIDSQPAIGLTSLTAEPALSKS